MPRFKEKPNAAQLYQGLKAGKLSSLSRAITLVESRLPDHQDSAAQLLARCAEDEGQAFRLGITGSPGVGKSTFIEAFGLFLIGQGYRLGVLSIDPSSTVTGGSILGDKTRMQRLSVHPNAFVRPSPAGDTGGGVNWRTREAIVLLEAWGVDFVIVETVGVGQSETLAHKMVDFFLLLQLAGAGDQLQGIKRGIVELADGILITKADGDNIARAKRSVHEFKSALHLLAPPQSGWLPFVDHCSAQTGDGLERLYAQLKRYQSALQANAWWQRRRATQRLQWFEDRLQEAARRVFFQSIEKQQQTSLAELRRQVQAGELSPVQAVNHLLKAVEAEP